MRRGLILYGLALFALLVQGVAATFIPPYLCPDLAFLFVIALALLLPPISGVFLAAGIGYATDVLAAGVVGQHALLALCVFGLTRVCNRPLDLRRPTSLALYVAVLSTLTAVAMVGVNNFMAAASSFELDFTLRQGLRAAVNAIWAWPLLAGLQRIVWWLSDSDRDRRGLAVTLRDTIT